MTEHQKARRARKSAAFFAKRALAAQAAGDRTEARRLAEWAQRKGADHYAAKAQAVAEVRFPRFHQNMMAALDGACYAGANLPAHAAIRRAFREANMSGRQFASPSEVVDAIARFSPILREKILEACQAA